MPDTVGRLRPPRIAGGPATPAVGELYYDTVINALYYWNGSTWVSASAATTNEVSIGSSAPGSPAGFDLWVDTSTTTVLAPQLNPTVQASAYTARAWDYVICNAAINVTLPATPPTGTQVGIQAGSGTVAVLGNGANIFRFATSVTTTYVQNQGTLVLIYDGSNWRVVTDTGRSCYARRYHNQAWGPTTANSWYLAPFQVADGGDDSLFNTSGYYVCPIAGNYQIRVSWCVGTSASPTTFGVAFGRASAQERIANIITPSAIAAATCLCEGVLACNAGDVIVTQLGGGAAGLSKTHVGAGDYACNFIEVMRVAN